MFTAHLYWNRLESVIEYYKSCYHRIDTSFTHVLLVLPQGDLDRQRLLGDRPRDGLYESILDEGLEGIEQQER